MLGEFRVFTEVYLVAVRHIFLRDGDWDNDLDDTLFGSVIHLIFYNYNLREVYLEFISFEFLYF